MVCRRWPRRTIRASSGSPPEEVTWKDFPNGHGAQMAIVVGDPTKPGIYVTRVKFPPHVMDRPHWHAEEQHITVLKGTWYTGTGDTFDPEHAVPLKPGSYMLRTHPAGTPGRRDSLARSAQAATATLDCWFAFQFQGSRSTTLLAG